MRAGARELAAAAQHTDADDELRESKEGGEMEEEEEMQTVLDLLEEVGVYVFCIYEYIHIYVCFVYMSIYIYMCVLYI